MPREFRFALGLVVLVLAPVSALARCGAPESRSVTAGRDAAGYFVAVDWKEDFFRPRKGDIVDPVGDYLAREAGVTILYTTYFTEADLPRGRFVDSTPLGVMRKLAEAAGLKVLTPQRGLWVVESPNRREPAFVNVFARRLDPGVPWIDAKRQPALEEAILNGLRIRHTCEGMSTCTLGFGYFKLEDEPGLTILVEAMEPGGLPNTPPVYKLFRLNVTEGRGGFELDCVWSATGFGPVAPEIAEDFDGDGVRDLVSLVVGDYDNGVDWVISGSTGERLFSFLGNDLYVEEARSGAKRVSVNLASIGVDRERRDPWAGPALLKWSPVRREFDVFLAGDDEASRSGGGGSTSGERAAKRGAKGLLTEELGGKGRIRHYVLRQGPAAQDRTGEDTVTVRTDWREYVNAEAISKGYPARLMYSVSLPLK